jgi:addiction module HigA family antidote
VCDPSKSWGCRPATDWRSWLETAKDNGPSASTANGGYASFGKMEMLTMSKSPTITNKALKAGLLRNPHPGEILLEEFLKPGGLSQNALARAINVPPRRINEIVLGQRAVTADTDLRLSRYYGMSEGFFLGLQADFELMERKRELGKKLEAIKPRAA